MSKGLGMLDGITCQDQWSSRAYRKQEQRLAPTSPDIIKQTHIHVNKQTKELYIVQSQASLNH